MQVQSQLFVAAVLTLALATACSKRAEQESADTAPPASETAETADAAGTTTTFEESTPAPQQ
ncbi:MAG: hypothetical protein ACREV5_03255 [Steroidobacter sp.]